MTVPIIILNYNSHSDCDKCLSFLRQQRDVDLEIIVVDNNSCAEDLMALRTICSKNNYTLLESKENRGYNAGNNIGLRYASEQGYTYALITNPDMEFPDEYYVATMVREMELQSKTERAVVVASDIVTPKGVHQNPLKRDDDWRMSWSWLSDFFRPNKPKTTYIFIDDYTRSHTCAKVSGCCFLIRMDFVESLGYFDEGVFLYNEEAILSRQVENAQCTMYYTAETQAIHHHIESNKSNPLPRLRHRLRANNYYIDKYSDFNWWKRWAAKIATLINIKLLQFRCYWKM